MTSFGSQEHCTHMVHVYTYTIKWRLPPGLMTRAQSPEPTWWKDRTDFLKLSSDFHIWVVAHVCPSQPIQKCKTYFGKLLHYFTEQIWPWYVWLHGTATGYRAQKVHWETSVGVSQESMLGKWGKLLYFLCIHLRSLSGIGHSFPLTNSAKWGGSGGRNISLNSAKYWLLSA